MAQDSGRTPADTTTEPTTGDAGADGGPIRVVICDDHAVFRRGLTMVLADEEGIEVAGEAAHGNEAVAIVRDLAPDVVLMDVRMPELDGIEATRQIAESAPATKIIMLTVSDEESDLYEAVKAGAAGYVLKEISIEEVAAAIRSVVAGQSLISPSMASKLLTEFSNLAKQAEDRPSMPAPKLTDRELEVLEQVALGKSNKDIATELFIAENTVKNHVRNILEKLQLHTRMEAVMYAVREKLLDIPEA